MRILLWPGPGRWTSSFLAGAHEYVMPAPPDRSSVGSDRSRAEDWPATLSELPSAALAEAQIDVVILQRREELALASQWLGRRPGVDVPAMYVEHHAPDARPCTQRHLLADQREVPIVHVTQFNQLFWDNGVAPTVVIEPGLDDPGPRYSGQRATGAVLLDDLVGRGRVVGSDLISVFAGVGPIDLFGIGGDAFLRDAPDVRAHQIAVHAGSTSPDQLLWELAGCRAYLHPVRWTSLDVSLIEAMLIGMPVLALATTATVEAVPPEAGVTSLDVDRLAREFRTYLNEPEIARYMGSQARKHALRRYGLSRFLDDWDNALTAALQGDVGGAASTVH